MQNRFSQLHPLVKGIGYCFQPTQISAWASADQYGWWLINTYSIRVSVHLEPDPIENVLTG